MRSFKDMLIASGVLIVVMLLVYGVAQGLQIEHENELLKAYGLGYECGKANSTPVDIAYWRATFQMEFLKGYNAAKEAKNLK